MIYWILSALLIAFAVELQSLQVSGLTYLNTFKPGESAQVRISLISDRNTPEMVDLKLCDYWCNSDGQHFFEEVGKQVRSNAHWIKLGSHREIVNPGETRDFYFTINVPQDNALKGSYWSVLLIEPYDALQTLSESEHGFQLHVKIRYAFHIVSNVGVGTPALKIVDKGMQEIKGKKYFMADVANTGDWFLNPKMTVKLLDKKGKLEKSMETQTDRLYPGSSVRYLADGEGIFEGKYTAFLLLDNGDGRLFGDTFEISYP